MSELGHELEASLQARQEVGAGLEPQLVEQFVDRIEGEIDRRIDAKLSRPRHGSNVHLGLPLGSLAISIPLLGIAGGTAGFAGVLVIAIAIVLVNLFWAGASRR